MAKTGNLISDAILSLPMWTEAFLSTDDQSRAYEQAFRKGGDRLSFEDAVGIAASRLSRAATQPELGQDLFAGLLESERPS